MARSNSKRPHLTRRQTKIVRLTSLGCSRIEYAAILGIAEATAENHKASAMASMGTDKSAILTRLAIKYKISPLDEKLTAAEKRKSGRKGDGWN